MDIRQLAKARRQDDFTYRCPNGWVREGHARVWESAVRDGLRRALPDAIAALPSEHASPAVDDSVGVELEQARRSLSELDEVRARYQRAFGRALLREEDLAARLEEVDLEQAALERRIAELSDSQRRLERRARRRSSAQALQDDIENVLANLPPAQGNTRLADVIEKIEVDRTAVIGLLLRDE